MPYDGTGAPVINVDKNINSGKFDQEEVLGKAPFTSDETAAAKNSSLTKTDVDMSVDELLPKSQLGNSGGDALSRFQTETVLLTKKLGIYEPPSEMDTDTRGTSQTISSALDGARFAPSIRFQSRPGAEPVGYPINKVRFGRLTNIDSQKYLPPPMSS
jgi:hypothetical protein